MNTITVQFQIFTFFWYKISLIECVFSKYIYSSDLVLIKNYYTFNLFIGPSNMNNLNKSCRR